MERIFQSVYRTYCVPVWIHFTGIPVFLLDEEALLSIASVFGAPLYVDPKNIKHEKVGYASVCVALDVAGRHPEVVLIEFTGKGKICEKIVQKVTYENMPSYCTGCFHIGHSSHDCKVVNINVKKEVDGDIRVDVEGDNRAGVEIIGPSNKFENKSSGTSNVKVPDPSMSLNNGANSRLEQVMEEVLVHDDSSEDGEIRTGKMSFGKGDSTLKDLGILDQTQAGVSSLLPTIGGAASIEGISTVIKRVMLSRTNGKSFFSCS